MHPIIHTEAFVLKSTESGEANKRVWLFTREYGLIIASVQGVRKSGAKLRSHIVDYTYIHADLVKGREVWRLVSAHVLNNPFTKDYDKLRARSYIRALSLVQRFCIEEGIETDIFNHLFEILEVLETEIKDAKVFDAVVLWKILVFLGYIDISEDEQTILSTKLSLIEDQSIDASRLIKTVTSSISQSHL